ncbi:RICIN domain-containing protein [Streptomyces sp. NPDC017082]|uniref:RICIN domain-containing protein n=1 Tax=Streptomyces sp. NPDC017082 TaxID=3364974 RepID=UPI003791CC6F
MTEAGPSDEQLSGALKNWTGASPAPHPVGALLDRHWAAALAYARLCADGPRAAGMLTTAAFTRLFGDCLRQAGPGAAWRPQVLVAVRGIAAEWSADERRELLHPALRSDARTLLRPAPGRPLLSRAFRRLPDTARAVLWHTEVESEPLAVPAALLGLDEEDTRAVLRRARERLREECLQAHRELALREECRRYPRLLDVTFRRAGTAMDPDLRQHLAGCAHCDRTAEQLARFHGGLGLALAEAILGWHAHSYVTVRATYADEPSAPPRADTAVTPTAADTPVTSVAGDAAVTPAARDAAGPAGEGTGDGGVFRVADGEASWGPVPGVFGGRGGGASRGADGEVSRGPVFGAFWGPVSGVFRGRGGGVLRGADGEAPRGPASEVSRGPVFGAFWRPVSGVFRGWGGGVFRGADGEASRGPVSGAFRGRGGDVLRGADAEAPRGADAEAPWGPVSEASRWSMPGVFRDRGAGVPPGWGADAAGEGRAGGGPWPSDVPGARAGRRRAVGRSGPLSRRGAAGALDAGAGPGPAGAGVPPRCGADAAGERRAGGEPGPSGAPGARAGRRRAVGRSGPLTPRGVAGAPDAGAGPEPARAGVPPRWGADAAGEGRAGGGPWPSDALDARAGRRRAGGEPGPSGAPGAGTGRRRAVGRSGLLTRRGAVGAPDAGAGSGPVPVSRRSAQRAARRVRRRHLALAGALAGGLVVLPVALWSVAGSGGTTAPAGTPGGGAASPGASWAGTGPSRGAPHGGLRDLASGLCVGVVGDRAVPGAETELTGCSAAASRQWTYDKDGLLRSAAAPGLCLDSRLGYSVRLAPCPAAGEAAPGLRYDFTRQGGALVPRSDRALALTPAATDGSGALVLKTRAPGAAQRWTVGAAPADPRRASAKWGTGSRAPAARGHG